MNRLVLVLALPLTAPRAFALGATSELDLRYSAPAECPNAESYLSRVEQRLGRDWEVALHDFAERIEVTVTATAGRYDGTVQFRTKQGELFTRSVSGKVCSEVTEGLSLMTALAVRSRAGDEPEPVRAGGEAPKSGSSARPGAAEPAPLPKTPEGERRAPATDSAGLHLRVGGRLSFTTGVGPEVALGVGAFSALELRKARIVVGADIATSNAARANGTEADFRLVAARLEGCPWSFDVARSVAFEPCILGELGAFRAAARVSPPRVTVSEPATISWAALGALGRFVLRIRPGFVEAAAFARAPLRRERFYVQAQDQVVFRIPAVSGGAVVGLGLEF